MSARGTAIAAELEGFKKVFDFTEGSFASDLAEAAAAAIYEYMDAVTGPDNAPWIELSPRYAAWKAQRFPGEKMSELHLKMKDPTELKGELEITPDRLTQTYGTTEETRQEACWFQEGDSGQNRPPRPFYAFNELAIVYVAAVADARFEHVIPA